MKKLRLILILLIVMFEFNACVNKEEAGSSFTSSAVEEKIDALIAQMTLEEKVGQLNQLTSRWEMTGPAPQHESTQEQLEAIKSGQVGSMLNVIGAEATRKAQELAVNNSRLGIPLIFGYDVIHGYKTMFPIPLGLAASWEPEAAERAAKIAAREATAAGINWTFAPMVDLSQDARWGRVMEGSGEDPYLTSLFGVANVKGFQGSNLSDSSTMAACAKHFAAYGFAKSGLDYNTVDISLHTLHNVVLPPFKACAEAGVATFMNAFNEIGGVPSTANAYLQRDLLKNDWGFDGFVVSDWGSINEIITHGAAQNKQEASKLAIQAGSDMDMEGHCYNSSLVNLVNTGQVDEALVDDAVRRILRIKFALGLFDNPYKYSNPQREATELLSKENLEASRAIARKTMVLLKNENGLLPLNKTQKNIAVIGQLAADKDIPLGSWRGNANKNSAVSLLEGIEAVVGKNKVSYAKGYDITIGVRGFREELSFNQTDKSGFKEAIQVAKNANVVIMAMGEDCFQSGEGRSQAKLDFKGGQLELLKAISKVNKNIVVVLMNGRPMELSWLDENIPSILESWFAGSQAGHAIADVLFGDYNPSGRLTMSFPRHVGQVPLHYNKKHTGRPSDPYGQVFYSHYTDMENSPLYPFGYGLSYTSFSYENLKISKGDISADESLEVSISITNTGEEAGEEVVQLYIRDVVASVTRPIKELKGFKKINIPAGEQQTVTFTLSKDDLSFYNANLEELTEPGVFHIYVGPNSRDLLKTEFTLKN